MTETPSPEAQSLARQAKAHRDAGAFDQAVSAAREALALAPDHAGLRVHLAECLLAAGNWRAGWEAYEARLKAPGFNGLTALSGVPFWAGEPLTGKHVLLSAEQGFGDSILFCRFAAQVKAAGAFVTLGVPAPLVPLLSTLHAVDRVVSDLSTVGLVDFQIPLGSLPYFVGLLPDEVSGAPYLGVDPVRAERWSARRGDQKTCSPTWGLVWQGRPGTVADRGRSVGMDALRPLLSLDGVDWVSLQVGPGAAENPGLPDWGRDLTDFAETAAAVHALDGLVTTDTAVAHVAGACGLRALVVTRYSPGWRWMGTDLGTRWYDSLHICRQSEPGDWAGAVNSLCKLVSKGLKGGGSVA